MASVRVKLFAVLRERLGADDEVVEYEGALCVSRLLALLVARHPELARVLEQCRVAVNRELRSGDGPIAETDEVAVIPPISGGAGCIS